MGNSLEPCALAPAYTAQIPVRYHFPMEQTLYDYTRQDSQGESCTAHAWAKVPAPLSPSQRASLKARAAELMRPWPGHDNHLHLRVQ